MLASSILLKDESAVEISNYAIAEGITKNSYAIPTRDSQGNNALLILVSGSVTINLQISMDGSNWYKPYCVTTDGLTDASLVATALTADKWIIHTSRLSYYTRYNFLANSDSVITATYIYTNIANAH